MKNRRSIRLVVEQLETRVVPAVVTAPPTPPAPYALWASSNWSGIDLDTTKGAVTAVSASWVVPLVTASGTGYSATWVGIDGDISNTVEQIGTESDTAATAAHDGTPQYYAWYEMYPAGYYYTTPQTVSPGDQITASVVYAGQTKTGSKINDNFMLSITDSTAGWTFSTTQAVPNHQIALRNSAEYIVEAPSGGGVLPLANFGSETFTAPTNPVDPTIPAYTQEATINGVSGTIASFVGNPAVINYGTATKPGEINIFDMGTQSRSGQWTSVKDETSLLNAAGNSFTVQFGTTNPAAPATTTTNSSKKAPNDRVFVVAETTAGLGALTTPGANVTVAATGRLLPDNMNNTAFQTSFLAGDSRLPSSSVGFSDSRALQANATFFSDQATIPAADDTAADWNDWFDASAGLGIHTDEVVMPYTLRWFAPPAGVGIESAPAPRAADAPAHAVTPQAMLAPMSDTDFGSAAPQFAVEGTVDRSAAALVFLTVALQGWQQKANAEDETSRSRYSARKRLPLHLAWPQ